MANRMCRGPMRCFAMAMCDVLSVGERIAEAARADLGRPFRAQGRGDEGLDCVGLVLRALWGGGWRLSVPRWPLRGHSPEQVLIWMGEAGLLELALSDAKPGDILLAFPATRQAHLAVRTPCGLVEANAGLRRVVERPWNEGLGWHSAWRVGARPDGGSGEGGA